jgi:hypothetical protein
MSQENVEIVRAAIEAVLRRPNPDWETINALYHQDHEFLPRDVELEGGGSRRGAQGYVVRTEVYASPEQALQAVGLSE